MTINNIQIELYGFDYINSGNSTLSLSQGHPTTSSLKENQQFLKVYGYCLLSE